jgi:histone H4
MSPASTIGPVGQGKGKGKSVPVRHRKRLHDPLDKAMTKPAIRRLARRGGVKRLNADVYDASRKAYTRYLAPLIKHALTYMVHARRRTVTVDDVMRAAKHVGQQYYV